MTKAERLFNALILIQRIIRNRNNDKSAIEEIEVAVTKELYRRDK